MVNRNKKRVLLYLGKFPGYGIDIDGGSILAKQLIDTLKNQCILDVVFIRKNKEVLNDDDIHQIRYVQYKDAHENKFSRRLKNLDTNREAIGDYHKYDRIIAAHTSKLFGFESAPIAFWERVILFPMFCTPSYVKAGEFVPQEYTRQESFVLSHAGLIISPSLEDKRTLVSTYRLNPERIIIIYRGIDPVFKFRTDTYRHFPAELVYIGSIKKQKNNIDAIKVLQKVHSLGTVAHLHLVGTIQDEDLYQSMTSYIESHNLSGQIHFHFGFTQLEVADLLGRMDINLSVSNWETFGRGIFEGVCSGLPTVAYARLTGVSEICKGNQGVVFVRDADEMATTIVTLLQDDHLFKQAKSCLASLAEKLSYQKEKVELMRCILP